jgi:DNA-binding response OmpR family regulator
MTRILVADDDQSVLDTIVYAFEHEDVDVDTVDDGEAALAAARGSVAYDLLILNVMMPRLYGTDVVRELQSVGQVPIVLLSARDGRVDRIAGFELGVDDYITKPFSPQELVSRVRAILRREQRGRLHASLVRRFESLELDFESGTVSQGGLPISLTRSEFRLVALLAERPGEVFSRREILEHLWHSEFVGDERAGDIHISNLRRKLGPEAIETIRGEGYRLRG